MPDDTPDEVAEETTETAEAGEPTEAKGDDEEEE